MINIYKKRIQEKEHYKTRFDYLFDSVELDVNVGACLALFDRAKDNLEGTGCTLTGMEFHSVKQGED